jgi:hypothetical protein
MENVYIYILLPLGIFYGDLGYFMTIWYILYLFGTKKNLATLGRTNVRSFP